MRIPAAILAVVVSGATAQSLEPLALVPVDPGGADDGPLSTSLRDVSSGLRVPTGFSGVYRMPGVDDRYMRVDGGLYAVFPRSHYANTVYGAIATIPDGTVFHIGPPWRHHAGSEVRLDARFVDHRLGHGRTDEPGGATGADGRASDARSVNAIQATAESAFRTGEPERAGETAADDDPPRPPIGRTAAASAPLPAIITDAAYRAERLRALMRRAATDG